MYDVLESHRDIYSAVSRSVSFDDFSPWGKGSQYISTCRISFTLTYLLPPILKCLGQLDGFFLITDNAH